MLLRIVLRWVTVRALWIVALGLILGGAGAYYSVQLYKNLRTDIEELLPSNARSVIDMNEVTSRLVSTSNLTILIFSDHPEASRRFVDDLAAVLNQAPKEIVASVEYRIDQELKWFSDRRSLYMELSDLTRVRGYIHDRLDYEKNLYNPLNIFSEKDVPEPHLDIIGMRKKYDAKTSSYSRFPDGYYATPDGKKRVILVYKPGKGIGINSIHRLKDYVVNAVKELGPSTYAPDIQVKYTGSVEDSLEEQDALVADLVESTIIVTVLVSAAMLVFFRAFLATGALLISLFVGTLWTFGVSFFAVGYLNANSAFLGSIIIGNGINCGIIFLARYLEERRNGNDHAISIQVAMKETWIPTLTASLAAGLSYGSLILTGFRGFKQFGIIGLIGMVLCWISAYTLLPALLSAFDWIRPLARKKDAPTKHLSGRLARLVKRFPHAIWLFSLSGAVLSALTFSRYSPKILETNLAHLRNKVSMERGSGYLSRYVDEIFQHYLSPMVILPHQRDQAVEISDYLKAEKAQQGPHSLLASVQTIDDFIPNNQPQKIQVLKEIRGLLPPKVLLRMPPADRRTVLEFLNEKDFHPIALDDLPQLVRDKFTERDGTIGKLVLVEPPVTDETLDGNLLTQFVGELRDAADRFAPGAPVAGGIAISADMIEAITRDGPRATLFAFLAVVGLVILLFRNFKTIALVLFALILGVTWLAGCILGFGLKINFLNFIALPITFGIGVDYGVNIFQRFRREGAESIFTVIQDTGGAVILCSFTTIVGYSSLLIADNQAFVSFGRLAVLGEICCVMAAVVSLPAFLLTRSKKRPSPPLEPPRPTEPARRLKDENPSGDQVSMIG